MPPFVRVASTVVPALIVARNSRIERRAIARLNEAGANTAERAILLEDAGRASRGVQRRLVEAGALVSAGNDRYYLNQPAYEAYRGRRRTRANIVLAVLAVIVLVMYYAGIFK
jgi:hypothetical protein